MKKRFLILIIQALAALTLLGCAEKKYQSDSQIPWARPAHWEGQSPALGM